MSRFNERQLGIGSQVELLDFRELPDITSCGKPSDMVHYIGNIVTIVGLDPHPQRKNFKVSGNDFYWAYNWMKEV